MVGLGWGLAKNPPSIPLFILMYLQRHFLFSCGSNPPSDPSLYNQMGGLKGWNDDGYQGWPGKGWEGRWVGWGWGCSLIDLNLDYSYV